MRTQPANSASPPGGVQVPSPADGSEVMNVLAARSSPPAVKTRLHSTRTSRAWARVLPAIVFLGLILLFIFQNLHKARVSFVTVSGTLPLGLALLAAAAFGGLFVLALGSARVIQLRKVIRHNRTSGTTPGAPK